MEGVGGLIEMLLQDVWVAQGRYRWKIWIDLQCMSIENPNTPLVALGGWGGGGGGEELFETLLQDVWVAQGRYRWKIWRDLQCVSIQNPNSLSAPSASGGWGGEVGEKGVD